MKELRNLLKLLRARQWVKNTLVFAAIIFSQRFNDLHAWWVSLLAFFAFSLAASSVYIINDFFDVEQDRLHPVKKLRPLAARTVSPPVALVVAALLFAASLFISRSVLPDTVWLLAGYVLAMILYSIGLKHVLLLDVFIVAGGLVMRAIYGAVMLQVAISEWLLICAFLISLVLAMVKRRQELLRGEGEDEEKIRKSLRNAPPVAVWDHWISAMAGITGLAYILYTVDPRTIAHVGSNHLLYTVPFVLYALLRYLAGVQVNEGGEDPTLELLKDRGIIVTVLAWLAVVLLVLQGIL